MNLYLYKCSNCSKYFARDEDSYKKDQERIKSGIKPDIMSCSENCTRQLCLKYIAERMRINKTPKIYTLNVIDK